MAQTPKGRLVQSLYKPIHGTCAMYFYLGVNCFYIIHSFQFSHDWNISIYFNEYSIIGNFQLITMNFHQQKLPEKP